MNYPPVISIKKSLFILWISHLLMDFFVGIWPIYKTLAHIDIVKAGIIAGISGFAGEILQVAFGYFCDRGHRKKVLLFGLLFASSIMWITFAENIYNSFFLLLLLMIGSGSFHPAATGMASSLAKEHKARAILFFSSGGAIGLAISQLSFSHLIKIFDGHATILLIPAVIIFLMLAFHKFPAQTPVNRTLSLKGFFAPIMHCKKPLLLLYFSQVATQAIMQAFMFLLPDLLHARECHSWLCLGGGHLCFVLGSAFTMVPAGFLCDKYGQKSVLLVVLSLAFFLLYLFLMQPTLSLTWTMLLLSCLGAFLGIINPIVVSWGNRLVPESPSTVSGLLMGFAWCIGNLGPACAGLIVKQFQETPFVYTIGIMGGLLLVILTLILLMPRPASENKSIEAKNI